MARHTAICPSKSLTMNLSEPASDFIPLQTPVPYAGRVHDKREVDAAVGAAREFWLTLGKHGDEFEAKLAAKLGVRRSLLVNSGSSANLVAISALTSPRLPENRRLRAGDEVITAAAGFPTTAFPIVQCGAVPVFVDSCPYTLNVRPDELEAAYSPGKTKAVMLAHTLGNPFDIGAVMAFCAKYGLWLIEDNCDALSSLYRDHPTGAFGDMSTQSFYPAHHITMGEGGAVNVRANPALASICDSFRNWGRSCFCPPGEDNTCGKRFAWKGQGELPDGYDHKFAFAHLGYNLKPTDIQAAIGVVQLDKLDAFTATRRQNWNFLSGELLEFNRYFYFQNATAHSLPSWFGFMLGVRPDAPFTRLDLQRYLDRCKIGHRPLFGGNLTRQPAFTQLRHDRPGSWRVSGTLNGADTIMREALFIGVYPGLTRPMLDHMVASIRAFCRPYLHQSKV